MNNITHIARYVLTACTLFVAIGIATVADVARAEGISVAGKVSTLGLGVELKYPFHEKFNGRLVFNNYDLSYAETNAGNQNEGTLKLNSYGLIGDWHPTGGGFRFSLGVLANKNQLSASTQGGMFTSGETTYAGRSNILLDFKSLSPYFGLGWSSQKTSGLSVDFEVGALFQGAPMLSGSGTATDADNSCNFSLNTAGDATVTGDGCMNLSSFEEDIEAEHAELQDSLNSFKIYPVLSLGIRYRF